MTDERRTLAKNLKSYRKAHNLSQLEFAEDCGISDVQLCHIERQNANVKLDTMQLLAARMGETVSDLLTDTQKITYCLIPSTVRLNDEDVITYGIAALQGNIILDYILDVSDEYNSVLSLAELCTEEELDPIHIEDVVRDFLVG